MTEEFDIFHRDMNFYIDYLKKIGLNKTAELIREAANFIESEWEQEQASHE